MTKWDELKKAAEAALADAWDLVPANEHHGPYVVGSAGDVADFYTMSNPNAPSVRNGGDSFPVPFNMADENAAFVAKANPSTILSLTEENERLSRAVRLAHAEFNVTMEERDPFHVLQTHVLDDLRAALSDQPKGE